MVDVEWTGGSRYGQKATLSIPRKGDLLTKMYIRTVLPAATASDATAQWAWVRRVGHALIKDVTISIGGQAIDKHTSGIFVTPPGVYPHLTATYTMSGSIIIKSFGNAGNNGNALPTNLAGTYSCDNGRNGKYWANINNSAVNSPNIGDIWFTIVHDDWNSVVSNSVDDQRKTADTDNYNHSVGVTGSKYLFCKVLVSRENGASITQDIINKFLSNYVQSMPTDMGFKVSPNNDDED